MNTRKPILFGSFGSLGLVAFYFVILSIAELFQHAVTELESMWYWIVLLATGFGVQLGLFVFLRESRKTVGSTAEVATSGGISAGAMVACCAHHLADFAPVLGLSAAALFLTRFRLPFILLGVFSNLIGIAVMLTIMQKHSSHLQNRIFTSLFKLNMKSFRSAIITLSAISVATAFLFTAIRSEADSGKSALPSLSTVINNENSVSFEVIPVEFEFGRPVEFEISINTHAGDLDFDLTEVSTLLIDGAVLFEALAWEGSSPGGHHRSGTLSFSPVSPAAEKMELIIEDVNEVPTRSFVWKLQ